MKINPGRLNLQNFCDGQKRRKTSIICGHRIMVVRQSSKLKMRVQFPLLAPYIPVVQGLERATYNRLMVVRFHLGVPLVPLSLLFPCRAGHHIKLPHFHMRVIRLDEEAVLKTVGLKNLGSSSLSARAIRFVRLIHGSKV